MAYDKVVDSAFLNNGLTAIADKIREKTGTTDALVFPLGFVSAIDAIEGGGVKKLKKYLVIPATILKSSGNTTNSFVGTYYGSVYGSIGAWNGSGEVSVTVPADILNAKGKFSMKNITSNELWYITDANYSYILTYTVYDLTKLASAQKVYKEEYSGAYQDGTYEFASDGNVYYYGEEED